MVIKLLADQIPTYWDAIKFAALSVNPLIAGQQRTQEYCQNLLNNLLSDKFQCWAIIGEDRQIKLLAITRIWVDIGDIPYLLIDVVYGFQPVDKEDFFETMKEFAQNTGCASIVAYTSNPMAANAAKKVGMQETHTVFSYVLS